MKKPTIAELERILEKNDRKIVVNPDGSIKTKWSFFKWIRILTR